MTYVLLMTTWLGGYVSGPITTSAEFGSLETCEAAGKAHSKMMRDNTMDFYWTCNKK